MSRIKNSVGSSEVKGTVPGTQEIAVAPPSMSPSIFKTLAGKLALHNITLHRTDWRDGPVDYLAIRGDRVRVLRGLSDITLVLWTLGGFNA